MAGRPLLPTYVQRNSSSLHLITLQSPRSILKIREKYLLFLTVALFIIFSIMGVYYLPDLKNSTVYLNYIKQPLAIGPNILEGLAPPRENGQNYDLNVLAPPIGIYKDELRLKQKAEEHFNLSQKGVIPKPNLNLPTNNEDEFASINKNEISFLPSSLFNQSPPILPDGKDSDPVIQSRRDFVKNMMIVSWDNYKKYAWGYNELKPISRSAHSGSIFGAAKLGATIIDGMDTLWIMGLKDRFNDGREWIKNNLNFKSVNYEVSVFETIIRFVGGLLSCYAFTHDKMFLEKAVHVADTMLPAFDTPTGLPHSLIRPSTGASRNYPWASASSSILSEVGSLYLEFSYLSRLTEKSIYTEKADRIRNLLDSLSKPEGLYYNYINPKTGKFGHQHVSTGALGDSFYEYLLKTWLISDKKDTKSLRMYNDAVDALVKNLLQNSTNGLAYFADKRHQRLEHKMGHLACFSAGMFALGAKENSHLDDKKNSFYFHLSKELANTCHESYIRTKTGLGPEVFWFTGELEAQVGTQNEQYYILRPEVIEGWFYLWRLTKDNKYRDWAWAATQAIQKYCLAPDGTGYSGIRNVNSDEPSQDDVQQSFFLAETLKYLYLFFSNDELISFNDWVFNTEAHPFPIIKNN